MIVFEGDIGNQISGGNFSAPVQQIIFNREMLAAKGLDEENIERFREIHVKTSASHEARGVLLERSAVALTGSPGCGRRTTGIALLADLEVTPQQIVLDPEDLDKPLAVLPGYGYLLDFDENPDQLTAKVGLWLQDLAARVRGMGSYVVVKARNQSWKALELDEYVLKAVPLTAPPAIDVFHSHLKIMTSLSVADDWAQREPVVQLLAKAGAAEGVRFAQIVCDVRNAGIPEPQQLDAAIDAYRNWTRAISEWFDKTKASEKGYSRALLLATAVLEGGAASTVFTAADQLASLVGLPREPGGVLVGPDLRTLVNDTTAELQGQVIQFTRPEYAQSVLDYVWSERPHMRDVMRDWLTGIPDPRDGDTGRAARSLTELAMRQGDGGLVCSAAAQWARRSTALRELAVTALTAAAMSQEVGREVRHQLYIWARADRASEELHLVVANVCGGPLARAYPQIALTRLRHLAERQSPSVQNAVLNHLSQLAQDPVLRHSVITEIATWVQEEREPRRSIGRRAFIRLASTDENGAVRNLTRSAEDLDLLAGLWREALRHDESAAAVTKMAFVWLDAAAQDPELRNSILEILAGTCRTSIDQVRLTKVVIGWPRDADGLAEMPSEDIVTELLHRAYQRDPITAASIQPGSDSS